MGSVLRAESGTIRPKFPLVILAITTLDYGMAHPQLGRIDSEVTCPRCEIVVESVTTLRDTDFRGPATAIARDPGGYFYLADPNDGLLRVFAPDGRPAQQIGRKGAGPGEYEIVRNIAITRNGVVVVLDAALGRLSNFTRTGEFRGSVHTRVTGGLGLPAVILSNGQIVVNTAARRPDERGFALQHLDVDGSTRRTFDEALFDPRRRWLHHRVLWAHSDGELFVGRPYTFAIDVYDGNLSKRLSLVRTADWIPAQEPTDEELGDGVFDRPYTPRLRALWVDTRGRLWLHMMVPHRAWRPGPRAPHRQALSEDSVASLAARPRVETIIEVIDIRRSRVLARSRFDGPLGLPFGEGYVASTLEDAEGEPRLRISRIHLRQ